MTTADAAQAETAEGKDAFADGIAACHDTDNKLNKIFFMHIEQLREPPWMLRASLRIL